MIVTNENIDFHSTSSSFVNYADYTNSSLHNFSEMYQFFRDDIRYYYPKPTLLTEKAIIEARHHDNLEVMDVETFFNDLDN